MTFERLKLNKAVIYARLLGFQPFGNALTARRHFYWYMPEAEDTFSVSSFRGDHLMSYTVNQQTSTDINRACKWLQEIERKRAKGKQHKSMNYGGYSDYDLHS